MANYTIGDMIFETRMARGYSQEELSFGICSTSSLSRIENNTQVPGRKIFEGLLQRLGVSESIYSVFVSREEMELYRLKQELVWKLEDFNFERIEVLIQELEKRLTGRNELERQYLLFAKASVLWCSQKKPQEALEMLLSVIRMTIPGFRGTEDIRKQLLTFDEITILNSIALLYAEMEERIRALELLFALREYMEAHVIDEEAKARKYPMLLYNITVNLGAEKRYEEAFELCGSGIEFCIKHNKLAVLPFLINNKACAAAELKRFEEARRFFAQAVVLFEICQKETIVEQIKTEAKERYNLEVGI